MDQPTLPTSVTDLNTTAGLLLKAIVILNARTLYVGFPGFTSDNGRAIDVPAAILLAHTGQSMPPANLSRSAVLKQPVENSEFYQHHPVGQAIRFLSVCIDHDGATDADGHTDYLDHVAWWPAWPTVDRDTHISAKPTYEQVITALSKAAEHAAGLAQQFQLATAA